ncbi:MAG TPA: hypothetical protein VFL91_22070, partial [Thermomicrobiales bacterium]|nr:hypothetical protein [Thermomicrobiales bacterium]
DDPSLAAKLPPADTDSLAWFRAWRARAPLPSLDDIPPPDEVWDDLHAEDGTPEDAPALAERKEDERYVFDA